MSVFSYRPSPVPPTIPATRELDWPDEAACAAFASALARHPGIRDAAIELDGTLGAGKTTFVRHLLRALGVAGRIKSPSYALIETYALPGGGSAAHLDFYRMDDPREWWDAGLREVYAASGLKIAEWATKAGTLLPLPDLRLAIEIVDDERRHVRLTAHTPRGMGLLG